MRREAEQCEGSRQLKQVSKQYAILVIQQAEAQGPWGIWMEDERRGVDDVPLRDAIRVCS